MGIPTAANCFPCNIQDTRARHSHISSQTKVAASLFEDLFKQDVALFSQFISNMETQQIVCMREAENQSKSGPPLIGVILVCVT